MEAFFLLVILPFLFIVVMHYLLYEIFETHEAKERNERIMNKFYKNLEK